MKHRTDEQPELDLGLPAPGEPSEAALRRAFNNHVAHGMTFEEAMSKPAIATCLRHIARVYERHQTNRRNP